MIFVRGISALFLALFLTEAIAEEEKSPWKSSAELGYVHVSGNTNTETLKVMFDISYEIDKWLHKAHAEALSSKSKTTDTTAKTAVNLYAVQNWESKKSN